MRAPILNHDFFAAMAREALRVNGPEIAPVRAAARRHGVHVSLGFSEGTDASVGCMWNPNILIGPNGSFLNLHRKLVPTFFEKLVSSNGDARGLRVTQTDIGRIGMLICGENTNPPSRFAKLITLGFAPVVGPASQMREIMERDLPTWRDVVKKAGVGLQ